MKRKQINLTDRQIGILRNRNKNRYCVDYYNVEVVDDHTEFVNGQKMVKVQVTYNMNSDFQKSYYSYLMVNENYEPLYFGTYGLSLEDGIVSAVYNGEYIYINFNFIAALFGQKYVFYKTHGLEITSVDLPSDAVSFDLTSNPHVIVARNNDGYYLYSLLDKEALSETFNIMEDEHNGYFKVYRAFGIDNFVFRNLQEIFAFYIDEDGKRVSPIFSWLKGDFYECNDKLPLNDIIIERKKEVFAQIKGIFDNQNKKFDEFKQLLLNTPKEDK